MGGTQQTLSSTPTHFTFTLIKMAVSQICQSRGFKSSQSSALSALTTTAVLYLQNLAKLASQRATSNSRTETNLVDVISALEDLGSVRGFPGCSDPSRPVLKSNTVSELMKFVARSDEIPFAKTVSWLCEDNKKRNHKNGTREEEVGVSGSKHIPNWLPAFPDESTYKKEKKEVIKAWNNDEIWNSEGCSGKKNEDKQRINSSRGRRELMKGRKRKKVRFQISSKKIKAVNLSIGRILFAGEITDSAEKDNCSVIASADNCCRPEIF